MNFVQTYFTYKFLKTLVTPWEKSPAYIEGVIDDRGVLLVKPRDFTDRQAKVYTYFDRLAYNLKRLLNKVPGGKTKIASYAAALALIREHDISAYNAILRLEDGEGGEPADPDSGIPTNNTSNIDMPIYPIKLTKRGKNMILRKKVRYVKSV